MKGITKEAFEERIKQHYPEENFEIIEYTAASNPFKVKCLSCGQILSYPQAKNFLVKSKKAGCSDCHGIRAKNKKNLQQVEDKYEILETIRNANHQLLYTCKCKKCGRIATHALDSFIKNTCRCEGPGNHYTEEEFKAQLQQKYGEEYILLSPFSGVNTKSLFKHSCGFVWSVTPSHILYNGTGCPKCSYKYSKGNRYVESCLKEFNISYERERFLQNSLQRFDFYIEYEGQAYAIEYNGKQHYEYIPFLHGYDPEVFKKYQERDAKKAEYCAAHNINLIVIPYTWSKTQIKQYINKLFSSSTTSPSDVGSSESK